MPKFPSSSYNHANVSGISGVLKSSQITNDKKSSGNSKAIRSNLQIKSVSRESGKLSIPDEGEHVDSCRIPATLLTPVSCTNKLEGKMHDDAKQHSLDYDQTDRITSSTDYRQPNRRLNFEEENKKNPKFQVSTVPELRGSPFIRKSRSNSISISHLDTSALIQVTSSINATMASAADAAALDSSASQSSCEANLPPIESFVSTETTNTKVEAVSFETCVISQKTTLQESTGKAEQMDTENATELDLFTMPSGYHVSTIWSPITNLNNEKMHDKEDAENSHEKEVDNLDALVNEKTISLELANTTQCLFLRACNFANGGKKILVLGQDCNHIISVRLQINDGKRIQVERNFPSIATEGLATSVLRGISTNRDCSKII